MALPFSRQWHFPNLVMGEYQVTSEETEDYNCVGWALGDTTRWWWPEPDSYWPPDAPNEVSLAAFITVLEMQGYERCDSAEIEEAFEKVAIFARHDGTPTHIALQKPDGIWTSKLGRWEDIEHRLQGLEDSSPQAYYGTIRVILRKLRGG